MFQSGPNVMASVNSIADSDGSTETTSKALGPLALSSARFVKSHTSYDLSLGQSSRRWRKRGALLLRSHPVSVALAVDDSLVDRGAVDELAERLAGLAVLV